jgi:hypothetical protein
MTTATLSTAVSLEHKVDYLGALLEQIKTLTEQADFIKDQLKDAATLEGNEMRVTGMVYNSLVYAATKKTTDKKAFEAGLRAAGIDPTVVAACEASAKKESTYFAVKTDRN